MSDMDTTPVAPPPVNVAPPSWRMPTIGAALGLIAFYFALQLAATVIVSVVVGIREGHLLAGQSASAIKAQIDAIVDQPDNKSLLVIVALPLVTLITLWTTRRFWPCMWLMPQPPGFGMRRPQSNFWFAVAALVGVAMPLVGAAVTDVLARGHVVTQNIGELGRHTTSLLRFPLIVMAVAVAPLMEEVLFRGVLLSALMRRLPATWAVLFSALLFAVVHLEGLHFQWYALPNLFLLAVALGWLRVQAASLWPSIFAHGIYNLVGMIALITSGTSP